MIKKELPPVQTSTFESLFVVQSLWTSESNEGPSRPFPGHCNKNPSFPLCYPFHIDYVVEFECVCGLLVCPVIFAVLINVLDDCTETLFSLKFIQRYCLIFCYYIFIFFFEFLDIMKNKKQLFYVKQLLTVSNISIRKWH